MTYMFNFGFKFQVPSSLEFGPERSEQTK